MKISEKPLNVKRTGDDAPAASLLRYVWRMSEWHQVFVCLVAVVAALLSLVPIELQRRIINEAVESRDLSLLAQLGYAYVAVVLAHQLVKFGLWIYQSWLTESTSLYTRRHLLGVYEERQDQTDSGRTVSIIGSEVEKLSGFVGGALSGACANTVMLLGVVIYMFVVEPKIAVFALAFLVPQIVLTPWVQKYLNELLEKRVVLLRDLGEGISQEFGKDKSQAMVLLPDIYSNRIRFYVIKFGLKSVLNLLNAIGPMTVMLFGGYLVIQGETQVGVIVAFISGFERISSPLRELIGFYRVAALANVQHKMIANWLSNLASQTKTTG
ncbi:ABC transporter transmembrane domain-containing protein [Ruegeria atlantica]|nr:ABC transporter ATP-binding protein [Ruegeria atlantica]